MKFMIFFLLNKEKINSNNIRIIWVKNRNATIN